MPVLPPSPLRFHKRTIPGNRACRVPGREQSPHQTNTFPSKAGMLFFSCTPYTATHALRYVILSQVSK